MIPIEESSIATPELQPARAALAVLGVQDPTDVSASNTARVFFATDTETGEPVAVKILSLELDELALVRFEREQERLQWRKVYDHPHVVSVLRSGISEAGVPYLVMAAADGGSLAGHLATEGPLPWAEAVKMGIDLCGALETIHRERVLHRDITPGNILLDGDRTALLTNVGLSALRDSSVSLGDVTHTAPEALDTARRTVQSDIYSLASTLHELMSGLPPFARTGDTELAPVLERITREPAPDLRLSGVPAAVARVMERAMAKNPAQRFDSAAEFAAALAGCQEQMGIAVTEPFVPPTATPTTPPPVPQKERPEEKRKRRLVAAALVLALGTAAFAAWPTVTDAWDNNFGGQSATDSPRGVPARGLAARQGRGPVSIATAPSTSAPTTSTAPIPELSVVPGRPDIVNDLPLLPARLPAYTEFKTVADANPTFVFDVPVEFVDLISIPGQVVTSTDNEAALANGPVSATIVSGSQIEPSQWDPDGFLDDVHSTRVTSVDSCPELKRVPFADGPFTGLLRAASCKAGELLIVDIVVTNADRNIILFLGFQLVDERDFAALDNTLNSFGLGDTSLLPTALLSPTS